MAEIATAWVSLVPSIKGIKQQIRAELDPVEKEAAKSGEKAGESFGSGFKNQLKDVGKTIAGVLAVTALVDFGRQAVQAASDLEQAMGAVDATFGSSADQIHKFGETSAQTVGLATSEYEQMAATFGAQLSNMGVSAGELIPTTNSLIQMGADLAAQYGGSTAAAVSALSSLMRGERDPIERYGVTINDAAIQAKKAELGLDGLSGAADRSATTQATLALLMQQTGSAAGAFAREADTLAGRQQRLNAEWENTKAKIGAALMPAAEGMVSLANSALPVLESVGTAVGNVASAFADLPAPVQAFVGTSAGIAIFGDEFDAVKGHVESAASAITGRAGEMRTAFRDAGGGIAGIRAAAGGVTGVMKTAGSALLGAFGGPAGLAVSAATALITWGIQKLTEGSKRAAEMADQAASSHKELAQVLESTGTIVGEQGRQWAFNTLEAAKWGRESSNLLDFSDRLGVSQKELVDGLVQQGPALDTIRNAYNDHRAALIAQRKEYANLGQAGQQRVDQVNEEIRILDEQMAGYENIVPDIEEMTDAQRAKAEATAVANEQSEASATLAVDEATGIAALNDAQKKAFDSSAQLMTEQTAVSQALASTKGEADAAARAVQGLTVIMDEHANRNLSAENAAVKWGTAIDDARGKAEDLAAASDWSREALAAWDYQALAGTSTGRDLVKMGQDLASSYAEQVGNVWSATAGTEGYAAAQAAASAEAGRLRGEAVAMLQTLGLTPDQANAAADALGLLDSVQLQDKDFSVLVQDAEAQAKLQNIKSATIDGKTVYLDANTDTYYTDLTALLAARNVANPVQVAADITAAQAAGATFAANPTGGAVADIPTNANLIPATQQVNAWQVSDKIVRISADISPAIANVNGWTPQQRIAKVDADLSPAIADVNGWTPLMRVVKIDADLSPAIADVNGWTPLQRIVKIDADISPAVGVIMRWQPQQKEMTVTTRVDASAVNAYQPPTKTMVVQQQVVGGGHFGGAVGYGMAGGATHDYGSYTSDDQLWMLHRGEHIFDTGDVDAMGGQAAVYAFRRALHDDRPSIMAPAGGGATGLVLRIEGDGMLAEIIRQTARIEIDRSTDQQARALVAR